MMGSSNLTIRELRDYLRDHGDDPSYLDYYRRHENPFYIDVINRAFARIRSVIAMNLYSS